MLIATLLILWLAFSPIGLQTETRKQPEEGAQIQSAPGDPPPCPPVCPPAGEGG